MTLHTLYLLSIYVQHILTYSNLNNGLQYLLFVNMVGKNGSYNLHDFIWILDIL